MSYGRRQADVRPRRTASPSYRIARQHLNGRLIGTPAAVGGASRRSRPIPGMSRRRCMSSIRCGSNCRHGNRSGSSDTLVEQVRYDGKTGTVTLGFRSDGIKDSVQLGAGRFRGEYEHAQQRG